MRLRNVKNAGNIVRESKYTIDLEKKGMNIRSIFNNDNPISIEIGMGKGDFLIGMAEKYPDINFIGVELYESVLVRAIQKLENLDLDNIRVLNMDAKYLGDVFDHEIDTIYLNFSDPWPKNRHAKRRLTSPDFLHVYDNISAGDTHIIQKTDNIDLFAYSISSLSTYGYTITRVSLDLAESDIPNVLTEYEKKFMDKGVKINYLDAYKKN